MQLLHMRDVVGVSSVSIASNCNLTAVLRSVGIDVYRYSETHFGEVDGFIAYGISTVSSYFVLVRCRTSV